MTTSSTRSWRELVEQHDDENRKTESEHPVVYVFSNNVRKRDSGDGSGIYEK